MGVIPYPTLLSYKMNLDTIYNGEALEVLRTFPDNYFDMMITSSPYYGLRRYGNDPKEIGRENTPEEFLDKLIEIYNECKRVVKLDGTLWINIADSYGGTGSKGNYKDPKSKEKRNGQEVSLTVNLKKKSLLGIPERLVLRLQDELGLYRRNTIIWHKPNAFPGNFKDRFTIDFEYLYFFSKSLKYYFVQQHEPFAPNSDVLYRKKIRANKEYNVKEPYKRNTPYKHSINRVTSQDTPNRMWEDSESLERQLLNGRNKRSVWSINTKPTKGIHPATFPVELITTPILAGCPVGGVVLDPFMGNGTTGKTARMLGRHFVGIELISAYIPDALENIFNENQLYKDSNAG